MKLGGAASRGQARLARMYDRSRLVRELVAQTRRRSMPDVAHLATYQDVAWGPIQADEALLLHGLVRTVRPATVVEIGFFEGHSALNFLLALDEDARLYSFDVDPRCEQIARERFGHDERFTFLCKSQTELIPSDIEGRGAEFVFLDASHDLDLNQATFERLLPMLAPRAIIGVHDTGTWPRDLVPSKHWWHMTDEGWVDDEREVKPDEREFMNWVLERYPGFSQLHLHSQRTARYGISLLQRAGPLPRPHRDD